MGQLTRLLHFLVFFMHYIFSSVLIMFILCDFLFMSYAAHGFAQKNKEFQQFKNF